MLENKSLCGYYDSRRLLQSDASAEYAHNAKVSVTKRDWHDYLFMKIVFPGITKKTQKVENYGQAEKAYHDLVASGKAVYRVVGHSFGGSVALELQHPRHICLLCAVCAPVL